MRMLNKEVFKDRMGTWFPKLEPLFDNGVMEELYSSLKKLSEDGRKILPEKQYTFRALRETPVNELKCVLVGLSPYHTIKNNIPVADGLMLGCSNHKDYIAPSLDQFYSALETEFKDGLCVPCKRGGDVSYLAHQGVLMFNVGLTTESGIAAAHTKLWEPFMKFFFEEIIAISNVPVVALGKEAKSVEKWLHPLQWYFLLDHPASASYKGTQWDSHGVFKKVNRILNDNNNETINWLQYEEQTQEINDGRAPWE